MATWSRDKVDSSTINSGNEYELQDRVSREQLNSMVNSGLYSQDFAEHLSDTPDTTNAGVVGTPNVELIDNVVGGKTYKKFKFSNLKGLTGNGISTVAKTSTSGLTDTYTITFTSGATTTFNVKNGKGINTIVKTGTVGIVDTYTITFNDSTTTTFMVSNGKGISSISKTGTSGLVDTYTITFNDSTTQTFTVTNGAKGDTGEGVPSGGTTGQIIKKTATSTEWANEYDGSNKVDKTTTGTLRRVYGVNASNVQELTEIETTPTSSSTKLITSGGIKTELDLKAKVDASNLTSGNVNSFQYVLGYKRVETVYDKDSAESSINWGKTGGILGGVGVTSKDFSKYNSLEIFAVSGSAQFSFLVDLEFLNPVSSVFSAQGVGMSDNKARFFCNAIVNSAKTSFTNNYMGYIANTTSNFILNNGIADAYIYKIRGRY